MEISVLDKEYKDVKKISLDSNIFGEDYREDIIHQVIRWQLAKRRLGCHKTKPISEVSGGGRKPYKQKGTGRARQGSIRSPQFRGGSVIFGPVVRSHAHKLNKKIRKLGLKITLSRKYSDENILVFDNYQMSEYKTRFAVDIFKNHKSVLVIGDSDKDSEFFRIVKNIIRVKALDYKAINVYDLVSYEKIFITEEYLKKIQDKLL